MGQYEKSENDVQARSMTNGQCRLAAHATVGDATVPKEKFVFALCLP